jgi:hypothetical protein
MIGLILATSVLAAGAAGGEAAPACLPDGSGYLVARLRGELHADLEWREPGLACTGMRRPDGHGMRLRFSGTLPDGSSLALVIAPPELAEGASARAVPVNVTVLSESAGRIYGTRGEQRCLLDEVSQAPVADGPAGRRSWSVEARGFCIEPARALDDAGAVLLTRFDFRGRVDLEDMPAAQAGTGQAPR